MPQSLAELKEYLLKSKIAKSIEQTSFSHDELCIVLNIAGLTKVLTFLKEDNKCAFKQLIAICGADYPSKKNRFELVYFLLSFEYNLRIKVKISVAEQDIVPSITSLYNAAGWYEREVWDMFGVLFADHPDLRRILTDYGFEGHPLRKDFPLTGHVEVRYDIEQQKVVYEPVNLTQEYRRFDFLSPWEGPEYILPGDEKATK
jgi:NADH-quinone oxidoreductase subunit C